jgi:hypothetical protein
MSAQHMPGRICDACEGFCLQPIGTRIDAGVDLSFRIGQRVRHQDYKGQRVTGTVQSIAIEDLALMATIALDRPIVIPAGEEYRAINIYTQHVPMHELRLFDDRDELLAELLAALEEARIGLLWYRHRNPDRSDDEAMARIDAAIAKATGRAA